MPKLLEAKLTFKLRHTVSDRSISILTCDFLQSFMGGESSDVMLKDAVWEDNQVLKVRVILKADDVSDLEDLKHSAICFALNHSAAHTMWTEGIEVSRKDYLFFMVYKHTEFFEDVNIEEDHLNRLMLDGIPLSRFVDEVPATVVDVGVWHGKFLPFIAKRYPELKDSLLLGIDSGEHRLSLPRFNNLSWKERVALAEDPRFTKLFTPRILEDLKKKRAKREEQIDVLQHDTHKNVYFFFSRQFVIDEDAKVFKKIFGRQRVDLIFLRRMLNYIDFRAVGNDIACRANAVCMIDYNPYTSRFTERPMPEQLERQFKGFKVKRRDHLTYFWLVAKRT